MANRSDAIKSSRRISVQVHPSGWRGNTVWTPFRVRQVIGFLSQTQIWGNSCKPFGRCGVPVRTLSLVRQVIQQKCNRPYARVTSSGHGLVTVDCADPRSIRILQEVCSQKLTLIGKFQYSFRTTWHHIRTMFIICKPSGRLRNTSGRYTVIQITPEFCSNAERISVKTVRTHTW
jgi:hypothetical protein